MIPFLPFAIILYAFIINIYAFYLFYKDKKLSKTKKLRISESRLLTTAAIGGSLGALIGMLIFRHKTRHIKFKLLIPIILIGHFFLLILIF